MRKGKCGRFVSAQLEGCVRCAWLDNSTLAACSSTTSADSLSPAQGDAQTAQRGLDTLESYWQQVRP